MMDKRLRPKGSPRTPRRKASQNPQVGERFGRLVVVGQPVVIGGNRHVQVRCDCGGVIEHRIATLYKVKRPNCGCTTGPAKLVTWNGQTQTLTGWGRQLGMTSTAIANRLKKMSVEEALTKPKNQTRGTTPVSRTGDRCRPCPRARRRSNETANRP